MHIQEHLISLHWLKDFSSSSYFTYAASSYSAQTPWLAVKVKTQQL
jgi:hypothetical protein